MAAIALAGRSWWSARCATKTTSVMATLTARAGTTCVEPSRGQQQRRRHRAGRQGISNDKGESAERERYGPHEADEPEHHEVVHLERQERNTEVDGHVRRTHQCGDCNRVPDETNDDDHLERQIAAHDHGERGEDDFDGHVGREDRPPANQRREPTVDESAHGHRVGQVQTAVLDNDMLGGGGSLAGELPLFPKKLRSPPARIAPVIA